MRYLVIGLGNPGSEYVLTRHNMGRMALEELRAMIGGTGWIDDRKSRARVSHATIRGDNDERTVTLLEPDTFMNRSGESLKQYVRGGIPAEHVIVIHDDLDLPLGTVRISFNRGYGGHHGVESVSRAFGTKAFIRVRVGITPVGAGGELEKPAHGDDTRDFILGSVGESVSVSLTRAAREAAKRALNVIEHGVEYARSHAAIASRSSTKKTP